MAAILGLGDNIYWNSFELFFIFPFHGCKCTKHLQALLVVTSHSFVIVAFETYNFYDLLVN